MEAWACVLADNPVDKLVGRYTRRVNLERRRMEASALAAGATGADRLFQDEFFLPAVPASPPAALAAKAEALYAKLARELAANACLSALTPLIGQKQSVEVMRKAQAAVSACLADLVQVHQLPTYTAKLTMHKDGTFTLHLKGT